MINKISKYLSVGLHPFLVPLYAVLVLLYADTAFVYYPHNIKFYILWVIALYTGVIPFLVIALLKSVGKLRSWSVNTRRERIIPLVVGIICAGLCVATFAQVSSLVMFRKFMTASVCCQIVCLAITFYWKISLHLATMGAVAAVLFIMDVSGLGNIMPAFIVAILLAGALASARLQLGCHNMAQVCAGFGAGFVTAFFAVLYL